MTDSGDYTVGYGKPPREHRFPPGKSGNSLGRPRTKEPSLTPPRLTPLAKVVIDEGERLVQVRDGDQVVKMPMQQAIVRQLGLNALKGDLRAAKLFLAATVTAQAQREMDIIKAADDAREYKLDWEAIFAECDAPGLPRPNPCPHPDDIEIDERTLQVNFLGAFSPQGKEGQERVLKIQDKMLEQLRATALQATPMDVAELQQGIEEVESLNAYLPPRLQRHFQLEQSKKQEIEHLEKKPLEDDETMHQKLAKLDALIEEAERIGRDEPMPKEMELQFMKTIREIHKLNEELPVAFHRKPDLSKRI